MVFFIKQLNCSFFCNKRSISIAKAIFDKNLTVGMYQSKRSQKKDVSRLDIDLKVGAAIVCE